MAGKGESTISGIKSLKTERSSSISSIGSIGKINPKSLSKFTEINELRIQTGYAEYYVENTKEDKIFTALLEYDHKISRLYKLCCCFKPKTFVKHETLYPKAPKVPFKRRPLNINGFEVKLFDPDNELSLKFSKAYKCKNDHSDETMKIEDPFCGLIGEIRVPESEGGAMYKIYDSNEILEFEIPSRSKDGKSNRNFYPVIRVNSAGEQYGQERAARIYVEGKHQHQELLNILKMGGPRIPAGDFGIEFGSGITPEQKLILLAAAFFIRIREFSHYIPMLEAVNAERSAVFRPQN